jgi:hypothetical protein
MIDGYLALVTGFFYGHPLAETGLELGQLDFGITFRITGVLRLIERIRRGEGQRLERRQLARWSGYLSRVK